MARRLFPDNDGWTSEASRAANNATVAFMDLLAILEEDGPVDLKDFHFIVLNMCFFQFFIVLYFEYVSFENSSDISVSILVY